MPITPVLVRQAQVGDWNLLGTLQLGVGKLQLGMCERRHLSKTRWRATVEDDQV